MLSTQKGEEFYSRRYKFQRVLIIFADLDLFAARTKRSGFFPTFRSVGLQPWRWGHIYEQVKTEIKKGAAGGGWMYPCPRSINYAAFYSLEAEELQSVNH